MKIDNTLKGISSSRTKEVRTDKTTATSAAATPAPVNDRVVFTPASAQLSAMEETLASMSITDAGKVNTVREAIAQGNFKVDEEVVADALVETTMEQLRHQGPA